jgi:CRISPR-associated endonuclease/helicase Cas3
MLISHPNKPLFEHLYNTLQIGMQIIDSKKLDFDKFTQERIVEICKIILALHDIGKSTTFFQEYMTDIQNGVKSPRHENSELKNHGFISAVIAASISMALLKDEIGAFIIFMVVLKHHSDLQDFSQYLGVYAISNIESETFKKQFESIDKRGVQEILDRLDIQYKFEKLALDTLKSYITAIVCRRSRKFIKENLFGIQGYLLINFIFSLLIYSDKTEAIFHSSNTSLDSFLKSLRIEKPLPFELIDNYIKNLNSKKTTISTLRMKSSEEVFNSVKSVSLNNRIFSINLPTGSGKTLTAIRASFLLRERLKKELEINARIIYLLPFTSIIEQNYKVLETVLDEFDNSILLKHHHFSEKKYTIDGKSFEEGVSEHLVETWESEIVVSTFVQFLHSVFSNKNRQLKKFLNIANSIIILDEVQSIPFKYWELVKELFFAMAVNLNCRFILMTATMPLIFSEEKGEIIELAKNKKSYFENLDRIEVDYSRINNHMNFEDFERFINQEIKEHPNESILIVANTIKSSIEIYKILKKILKDHEYKIPLYYISANIIPKQRLSRVEEIKKNPGSKIVVSTQVVEAGVDIDMDRVYRDFGPIDSINQVAGRCNRNGKNKKGRVIVLSFKDNHLPFAKYVYDPVLLEASNNSVSNLGIVSENDLYDISNNYYKNLLKIASNDEGNKIKEHIIQLEYKKAFDLSENPKAFRLIKENLNLIDVFVEIDENAKNLWCEYSSIKIMKNRCARKKAFNRIKNKFYSYIISVPIASIKKYMELDDEWITYIPYDMTSTLYDEETGFKRAETLSDYFL